MRSGQHACKHRHMLAEVNWQGLLLALQRNTSHPLHQGGGGTWPTQCTKQRVSPTSHTRMGARAWLAPAAGPARARYAHACGSCRTAAGWRTRRAQHAQECARTRGQQGASSRTPSHRHTVTASHRHTVTPSVITRACMRRRRVSPSVLVWTPTHIIHRPRGTCATLHHTRTTPRHTFIAPSHVTLSHHARDGASGALCEAAAA
jgi:hypothetical protein